MHRVYSLHKLPVERRETDLRLLGKRRSVKGRKSGEEVRKEGGRKSVKLVKSMSWKTN